MPDAIDPRTYYTRTVPAAFNRTLDLQSNGSSEERRVYQEMITVHASIHVEIRSEESQHFFLNIAGGRMVPGDAPGHDPFLTVILDSESFQSVAKEAGDSLSGLLGALAGLGADMKLTEKRVRDLEEVAGVIRLEVRGDAGFDVLTGFGSEPGPDGPDATIRMNSASYRALREGRLDPQTAFLDDAIQTEGDMQKVMQLAFAAVAPD